MKSSLALVAILGVVAAVSNTLTVCNANDCLRQVRATVIATRLAAASQDCAKLNVVTSTVTSTTTSTSTTFIGVAPTKRSVVEDLLVARQVEQPVIPTYAPSCKNLAAFASACNCIGVGATVVTSTVLSTAIATETVNPSNFRLRINYGASDASNPNTFLAVNPVSAPTIVYLMTRPSVADAAGFTLGNAAIAGNLSLTSAPFAGYIESAGGTVASAVVGTAPTTSSRNTQLRCSIDRDTLAFGCQYRDAPGVFALCYSLDGKERSLSIGANTTVFTSSQFRCLGTPTFITLTAEVF